MKTPDLVIAVALVICVVPWRCEGRDRTLFAGGGGVPPDVEGNPKRFFRVRQGHNLKLRCPVVGDQPFKIEWYKGDERIDPDSWTRHTVFGNFDRQLKIRRVDASSDAGSYICKGINGFGTSAFEFVVDVRGAAAANGDPGRDPAFRLQMLDGYLKDGVWDVGESASLRCGVKYNGAASVRWLKRVEGRKNSAFGIEMESVVKLDDGHLYEHIDLTSVTADSRMSEDSVKDGSTGVGGYSLSVNNVTSGDAGIYACIAIASFVDLDKTIKFRTARVTVRQSGDLVEASSTTSGQTLKGGLSELTICLIVLPVIIVLLIAVLLCVAVPKGRSKMPNSTHCCFRSGRNANNGEAAALTVSTAASSPSSTMNQDSTHPKADPGEDGRPAALQHSNSFTRATAPDPASFSMILNRPRVYQTPGAGRFPPGTPTRTPRIAKEHHREERQFISLLDPQPSPPPAQQQQRCHNCQSEYDTGDSWEDYFVRGKDENDEEEEDDDDDHEGASSSVAACPLPPAPPPSMLFLEPENGLISVNL